MKVTIFLNTAVGHKRDYIENFGKGIEKIGKDEVIYNKDPLADAVKGFFLPIFLILGS